MFNSIGQRCGACGGPLLSNLSHVCGGTVTYPLSVAAAAPSMPSVQITTETAWSGPICFRCNQGYLGTHDCDLIPVPCPDGREGCAVAHYGHKPQ